MSECSLLQQEYSQIQTNLEVIEKNATFLQHLIFDILDFSQIKYSQLKLNYSYFDLREIVVDLK